MTIQMNYFYIFTVSLSFVCVTATEIDTNFHRNDFTITLDNDFPYVAALHKFFEDKFEFVCTLVLIRPLWLLGSIIHCNLEFDRPKSKTVLTDVDYMMVSLHEASKKVQQIVYPEDGGNDIAILQLLYNASDEYRMWPSLELRTYSRKLADCFSVDFKYDDANVLIFTPNRIESDVAKCVQNDNSLTEKFLCSEMLNKSDAKYTLNGPLFCKSDADSVDVFGLKVDEAAGKRLWIKLSHYRLYVQKKVDRIVSEMFDFPNMAYLSRRGAADRPCTVFFVREDWLVGSVTECRLAAPLTSAAADWSAWFVTIVAGDSSASSPVVRIKFHDDYDRVTQENDVALVQVEPLAGNASLPRAVRIGDCSAKYTACYYMFWIHNDTRWGLCTAHVPMNHQELCPVDDLPLKLKDNAACTKSITINELSNTFVLLCDQLDGSYELIGMKIFDFDFDNARALRRQKENWISFARHRQMVRRKIDGDDGLVSKMESVAVLESDSGAHCTVAFLAHHADARELWFVGTPAFCRLSRADVALGAATNWSGFTVVTPYDERLPVAGMAFDGRSIADSTLFLLKCSARNGTKYEASAHQLIPDERPDDECVRLYGKRDAIGKTYVFKSEPITLLYDQDACQTESPLDGDDTYCSEAKLPAESVDDGVLLCKLLSIYHLVGLRVDNRTSKFRRWTILSTYKSWIGYVVNAESDEIDGKTDGTDKSTTSPAASDIAFDFGTDVDMPPYMVRITDRSTSACTCYGYILSRNLVATGSQCGLLVDKSSAKSLIPVDHVASIVVETKSGDVGLVRYVVFPEYNASFSLDEVAFLVLQWPLVPAPGLVELVAQGGSDPPAGTACHVIAPTDLGLLPALGYAGRAALTRIEVSVVDRNVCIEHYGRPEYVAWENVICTDTNGSAVLLADFSSGLFCDGLLMAIAAEVYNHPLAAIPARQQGRRVPIGWIRLEAFRQSVQTLRAHDRSQLRNVSYGAEADWARWSFTGSIQFEGHHLASCALIADHFAVTNADVIAAEQLQGARELLTVVFGSRDLRAADERREVHRILSVRRVSNGSSLLLVRLATAVSGAIGRASIIEDFILMSNLTCEAAGWPRETVTRWHHRDAFAAGQTLRSERFTIEYMLDDYIYTAADGGAACLADVGMPLACDEQLVALSAWDERCDEAEAPRRRWANVGQLRAVLETAIGELYLESFGEIEMRVNFLAAIFVDDQYRCIGTLVHARWVLTSAHCFRNATFANMKVVLGLVDAHDVAAAQSFAVDKYSVPYARCDDIALVELSRPADLGRKINLVDIASDDSDRACTMFGAHANVSVGWPGGAGQDRPIQMQELHPHTDAFCSFPGRAVGEQHVCTYVRSEDASFLRYAGGPLLCVPFKRKHRIQFAVNAWGAGRESNGKTTVVWTDVGRYSEWIYAKIRHVPEPEVRPPRLVDADIETLHETKIYYYNAATLRIRAAMIACAVVTLHYF